ncbi:MAG: hypothetical protein HYV26_06735 [Candidatus Hydrogenedentes bacterium]|nr:hypothetical protein [Candidatus Hydrogenedentota bacterium]MBI3117154.1 hypothetical protein [Candidatus Hydrogenedentota bacterium]
MIKHRKGVFCLETDWYSNLRKPTTVKPILELLEKLDGYEVPHIYRPIGTVEEFDFCLQKWTQKAHDAYPILYLAFHGYANLIYVGDKRRRESRVTLPELGKMLEGKCRKRIILFGSCSTLNTSRLKIQRFLATTGATAVFGYKSDVDWIPAAMFEMQVLSAMQEYALTRSGVRRMHHLIVQTLPKLSKQLTFRMEIAD